MSSTEHQVDEAFLREARIGLMVLTLLVAIFLYVAYGKLSGWYQPQPLAFQNQQEKLAEARQGDSSSGISGQNANVVGIRRQATESIPVAPTQSGVPEWSRQSAVNSAPPEPLASQPQLDPPQRPLPAIDPLDFQDTKPATNHRESPFSASGSPLVPPGNSGFVASANPVSSPPTELNSLRPSKFTSRAVVPENPPVRPDTAAKSRKTHLISNVKPGNPERERNAVTEAPRTNAPSAEIRQVSAATPVAEDDEIMIADEGDSFWLISQRTYGDGRYFDALYQFNKERVRSFNDVPAGTELLTPDVETLRHRWPRLCPREEILTEDGDTLFEIAGERLGQASRYVELLKLNYQRLPKDVRHDTPLPAGVTIELPRSR